MKTYESVMGSNYMCMCARVWKMQGSWGFFCQQKEKVKKKSIVQNGCAQTYVALSVAVPPFGRLFSKYING